MASNNSKAHRPVLCLCAIALLSHLSASAAVATSDDVAPGGVSSEVSAEPDTRASPIAPAATVGVPQSKTIELLLQLQDQPPSSSEGVRDQRSTKPAVTLPVPAPNAGPQPAATEPSPIHLLKEAILGHVARPAESSSEERAEPREEGNGASEREPESSLSSGVTVPGLGAKSSENTLLSHPVIRFIRENRALVLGGGVALLTALWLTANLSLRGRRP